MKVTLTKVPFSYTNTGYVPLMLTLDEVSADDSESEVVFKLISMLGAKEVLDSRVV